MRKIKLQQQPTDNSCTSTCLAMILGVPVDKVILEFHDKYLRSAITPFKYLSDNGIESEQHRTSDRILWHGELYLVVVPSLNTVGVTHSIIVDVRFDDYLVFDPNKGKEGKKYYIPWEDKPSNDLEVPVKSRLLELSIKD